VNNTLGIFQFLSQRRDMLNQVLRFIKVIVLLVAAMLLFISSIVVLKIILFIFDLPRKVGSILDFESLITRIIYRFADPQEMRSNRDQILHIIESEKESEDGLDRWGLLSQIDNSQTQIESRLKNGEFAFSFLGGITALIVGNGLGLVSAGIVLTVVVILVSLIVASRVIITDTLRYRSVEVRDEPLNRLVLYKAWNEGALGQTGAIAVGVFTVLTRKNSYSLDLAIGILELVAVAMYGRKDKWTVEDQREEFLRLIDSIFD